MISAAPPRHHLRQHEPRQLGQRHDVDLQHRRDLFRIRAIEAAAVAETRAR